jgi:hypothetical protein
MIVLLNIYHHWFINAIFMFNHFIDMNEFLTILYKNMFKIDVSDYVEDMSSINVYIKESLNEKNDLHILNSSLWRRFFTADELDNQIMLTVISCILNHLMLRWIMKFKMNLYNVSTQIKTFLLESLVVNVNIALYLIKMIDYCMNRV